MSLIWISLAQAQSLVVLDHLADPAETAWIEELSLALPPDTVVQRVPPEAFASAPLSAQLSIVRPWLTDDVRALAWLNEDAEALHLSVAFVETDRAVVRVVDLPRDTDAPARLALAARELVAQPLDLPPIPDAPVETAPKKGGVRLAIALGATTPVVAHSGWVRASVDAEGTAALGPLLRLGGSLGVQANGHHPRFVPRALVRLGPVFVGLGADVAFLPWVTWVQPRIELGLTLEPNVFPVFLEPRVRFTPVRDQVVQDGRIYDSGWIEFGLHVGLSRIFRRKSRQISAP